ncbi:unnamed protein product [Linum trigynum]|uniref:Bifunctional inhibitor/plant lipid transfer protein/seed storage helical domain-containing protein n=1 Tax=Linum trigynum TaxID=586398 RepID=A0AAV2CC27_9ROSI
MADLKALALFFVLVVVLALPAATAIDGGSGGGSSAAVRLNSDCRVDPSQLIICRPAVTGESPPRPTYDCCKMIKRANLPCLCMFKDFLPAFGIDPARALALPEKCGLKTPPECKSP